MTHKPATALPWTAVKSDRGMLVMSGSHVLTGTGRPRSSHWATDAAYIVHAANAYPRLVEALETVLAHIPESVLRKQEIVCKYPDGALVEAGTKEYPCFQAEVTKVRALLRELGEE